MRIEVVVKFTMEDVPEDEIEDESVITYVQDLIEGEGLYTVVDDSDIEVIDAVAILDKKKFNR